MSHFLVLVIGDNVEKQLAPYHEFECTGTDDEFVVDVDETESVRADYDNGIATRLRAPDGSLHSPYGEAPDGCVEEKCKQSDVESFATYCEEYHSKPLVPFGEKPDLSGGHKFGYTLVDEAGDVVKVVDRTNPNRKWDWWVVGGRWSGFLKLKPGAGGERGRPGVFGQCANDEAGFADVAKKGDIDFLGMRNEAALRAEVDWDKAHAASNGERWKTWKECLDAAVDVDSARTMYREQGPVVAIQKAFDNPFFEVDNFLVERADYIKRAGARAIVPFAFVRNGQWHAKGKMGWWCNVSDELDEASWIARAADEILGLPDDTTITVVDCHI